MDDENYEKEREELVSRFRQAIKGQLPDAWFDEDDLLDIFDFAGDNGDDYVRAEVLMWGARYFPDSDRLRERRGVFYADVLTDDAVHNFAEDTSNPDSLLTRILALRSERLSRSDGREKIKQIFEHNNDIDDEETIQLVTLANETSNLDWIVDNIDYAMTRVGYKPALLYEVAAFARDNEDYETAIAMLKRLVDEMPYNADYWNLLASAYEGIGDEDAALEAHDMTLAIDPSNQDAIAAKALNYSLHHQLDELKALYDEYPDNENVSHSFVQSLCYDKHPDAYEYLERHADKFGLKDSLVTLCVMNMPEHVHELADRYFRDNCTDNNMNDVRIWTQWSESLASTGAFAGATAMMEVLMAHQTDVTTYMSGAVCVLIELYYTTGQWQKIIDTVEKYPLQDVLQNLTTGYIVTVALMKLGEPAAAREYLESMLPYMRNAWLNDMPIWRPEQRIIRKKIVDEAGNLLKILNRTDLSPAEISAYIPL